MVTVSVAESESSVMPGMSNVANQKATAVEASRIRRPFRKSMAGIVPRRVDSRNP
ncbi:hypothetical protein Nm8I071_63970 [Nonomuraea sp. TT08I-71]|nr:hypothetical protein Nm8I071_63970 [Nonomuraea sp. TT08I-71]